MYTSMFRKAMLGDTALLALDFTTGTMPTAVTFTRADSTARATYIDASGYVKTVTAAGDPRFDYTGGVAKGLLVEAAATNLLKYSAYADTPYWLAVGGYVISFTTGITSPANDTSAVRLTFSSTGHGLYTNNTLMGYTNTVGATYTWSAWIRSTSGASNIRFGDSAVALGANIPITTTWTRYSYSYTAVSASGPYIASASGTPTGEFEMWGFQHEQATSPSSYINTTTASLTRLADDAVIRSTAWSSLYAQPGAMVVEFYRGAYGVGDRSILAADPTATRHWHLKQANASATAQIAFSAGSPVTQTGLIAGLNKVAIAWNAPTPTASFDLCVNGATPTFGGSNVGTTLSTWLTLGSQSTTGVSGSGTWDGYLNNSIKSVKYYNALTYAEMQAKTT